MSKYVRIKNNSNNRVIGEKIKIADSFWGRFRGLMLAEQLQEGEGLLISPCNSIHMMFMKFPIDAVFLDAENKVKALYSKLKPWVGFSSWHRDASQVLEIKEGMIAKTELKIGDILSMESLEC